MTWINRDISWLHFNTRVLQEAQNSSNPLLERLRFLGIYSNNLDEFYRVRVAAIRRQTFSSNPTLNKEKKDLLLDIRKRVVEEQSVFESTFFEIKESLMNSNVFFCDDTKIEREHLPILKAYFQEKLIHYIVPIIIGQHRGELPMKDSTIYLGVRLNHKSSVKTQYAIIEIPDQVNRFFTFITSEGQFVYFVDDIIRIFLPELFSIFELQDLNAYTFKFTRDAELTFDDDYSVSYADKMRKSIKQRKKGEPVRLVYDQNMPHDLLGKLIIKLTLQKELNTISGGKYHNFKDLMAFPNLDLPELSFKKQTGIVHSEFEGKKSLLNVLKQKNVLFHFPFHRFDTLIDILREAAIDPNVQRIWINVYRVAKNSLVLNSLKNAAQNGKKVTVVFELLARFDEEHNLFWAEKLKEAGVNVVIGSGNVKVHSKLILIERKVNKKTHYLSYVGSGNFNESTSKVYTDIGYFINNQLIAKEILMVFRHIENPLIPLKPKQLLISPVNNRKQILTCIQAEIKNAKNGIRAQIDIKMNNLTDETILKSLEKAALSGVKIRAIIRGNCTYIPSDKKIKENFEIRSIVGRYLEHSRFFIFANGGFPLTYISSADWMERNLDHRIEVAISVTEKSIQKELASIFEMYWNDFFKARNLSTTNFNQLIEEKEETAAQEKIFEQYL